MALSDTNLDESIISFEDVQVVKEIQGLRRFFLSLEDKLLRIFGGDQILNVMQNIGFQDDTPIQSSLLNNSLESAQKKVEAYYFDTRKQLFEYDQVLNMQRNGVYSERKAYS